MLDYYDIEAAYKRAMGAVDALRDMEASMKIHTSARERMLDSAYVQLEEAFDSL